MLSRKPDGQKMSMPNLGVVIPSDEKEKQSLCWTLFIANILFWFCFQNLKYTKKKIK